MMIAALMIGVGLGSFVISPLRQWLTLEQLYQGSTIYPLAALALAFLAVQWRPRAVLASAQPQSLFSSDCGASRSPIEGNQCGIVGPISHR